MVPDPLQASLLELLFERRSRRVGLGMTIPAGPFKYNSPHPALPLTEEEEAALAFAACGLTGYALADLSYGAGQGGAMLAGRLGRTIASPDAVHTVAVVVTNDLGTWLLKRPQDVAPNEFLELARLGRERALTELYRRTRVQLSSVRTAPPLDPGHNFSINQWSLYAPGTTYFLPVIETTALTLNVLLELLGEDMGVFLRDERARFRPAGVARFARSRNGHLHDNPHELRSATIQMIETALLESMATEQGMVLQNLALMTEALGLGGFPNFARHENSWFQVLGFRMQAMPASQYLGAPGLLSLAARWLHQDPWLEYPVGLERDNNVLLKSFCPPYYDSMPDAVRAYVDSKFGAQGSYGAGINQSSWRAPDSTTFASLAPSRPAVAATSAYCDYVFHRYRRFPAYTAPFRTVIGFQVCRVDVGFYDHFYNPGVLPDRVRASTHRALAHRTQRP
jgi:hypothetical protein